MALAAGDEIWRFEVGNASGARSALGASASVVDGSFFLGGYTSGSWAGLSTGGYDFAAVKIHSNGTLAWIWQEGTPGDEIMWATAAMADGGVVLAGDVSGNYTEDNFGKIDFVAVKLNSEGILQWRWREGTEDSDAIYGAQATVDGNVVLTGYTAGQWSDTQVGHYEGVVVKLDSSNGTVLWRYSGGAADSTTYFYDSAVRTDGSVVIAGLTYGDFDGTDTFSGATTDFIALALNEHGQELWRWQGGTSAGGGFNVFQKVAALDDGSVIMAGYTEGNWSSDVIHQGGKDFAVVKLTSLGEEDWRSQNGTERDDEWTGAATGIDGSSVILAGYTYGNWEALNKGLKDAVAWSIDGEGSTLWAYQEGTTGYDEFESVAVSPSGSAFLAGWSTGLWVDTTIDDGYSNFVGVLVETETSSTEDAKILSSGATQSPSTAPPLQEPEPATSPLFTLVPTVAAATVAPTGAPTATFPPLQATPTMVSPLPSASTPRAALAVIIGSSVGGVVIVALVYLFSMKKRRNKTKVSSFADDDTAAGENSRSIGQQSKPSATAAASTSAAAATVIPPPPEYSEAAAVGGCASIY